MHFEVNKAKMFDMKYFFIYKNFKSCFIERKKNQCFVIVLLKNFFKYKKNMYLICCKINKKSDLRVNIKI